MAKQRAIKLNVNRTFEEKTYPVDANNMKVGKDDDVKFLPENVFSEVGVSRFKFWKKARALVIFVDGQTKALAFSKATKAMQTLWTKKEATEHTKKQVAKARLKMKPMTWGQVILIALLLIIVIAMQAYSLSQGRF